jgi:pilus assembly protein CpaE
VRLRRSVPRGSVVVLANSREPEDILKAMRLGVREYLLDNADSAAFNDAVLRMLRQGSGSSAPRALMVAVMGVKGGVGGSHLAVNLAWALSQSLGQRVALTDLDLSGGDLALLLDVEPMRDFTNVASEFNRLDAVLMDSLLTEIAPGLRLLAAPVDPVAAEGVTAQHVGRALDHLADAHAVVLMDLSKSARRLLHLSERLGHDPAKWALVVNRDGAKGCVPRAEVQRALGKPAVAFLPNDSQIIMESSNAGRPVLRDWPRAKWSKEVMGLAKQLLAGAGGKR